jgi:hypothetical protein
LLKRFGEVRVSRYRVALTVSALLVVLTPLGKSAAAPTTHFENLPPSARVDYQLGGAYPPPAGVSVVTRDSTAPPAKGLYSICYINGYQTQPQDKNHWLTHYPFLVLRHSNQTPVFDPNWPDEMLLDTSSAVKRHAIADVIGMRIDLCHRKGFQAVEFDNLDSWTRSRGLLTMRDNVALATLLVTRAHQDTLAAGQKNTTELGTRGRDQIGFNFAVAEECHRYSECSYYSSVYGARVIDIEYSGNLRGTFAQTCADPTTPKMTILRDRDLTTPRNKHYVYAHC